MTVLSEGLLKDNDRALLVVGMGAGAFPASSAVLDDGNRANGLLNAGTGSTKWSAGVVGAASGGNWNITSNRFLPNTSGANHLSVFTLGANFDLTIDIVTWVSSYFAIFFSLQNATAAGWSGYWLFVAPGANTKFRKRVGGVTSDVAEVPVGSDFYPDGGFGVGDKIGIRRNGTALQMYRYTAGAWMPTPIIDTTDASISATGPIGFEGTDTLVVDNLVGGAI